jgi:hypothetical protein
MIDRKILESPNSPIEAEQFQANLCEIEGKFQRRD